jgi:peptide/nickel transport system substrate-binding protein
MMSTVSPVEKIATMVRYDAFPDAADRWSSFSTPKIAAVTVDGPAQVTIGQEGDFTVNVSFNNAAYPSAEIKAVQFLLFDATNTVVNKGVGTLVTEGQYTVALTTDMTGKLTAGSDKLVIVVVANPVAIPTFVTQQFVTVAP